MQKSNTIKASAPVTGYLPIDRVREAAILETGAHSLEPWKEIMIKAVLLLAAENNRLQDELIKIYQRTGYPNDR